MLDSTTVAAGRSAPGSAPVGTGVADRILSATVGCVAERGVARTTVDDIAREAGCGRATVYRCFAGGREAVLAAAARREIDRLLAELDGRLHRCTGLEETLVAGIVETTRLLVAHPVLRRLAADEPAVLRPVVSFDGLGPLLAVAASLGERHLGPHLGPERAREAGEWAARLIVAYLCDPAGGSRVPDLTDETAVRRLVRTYGLPGLVRSGRSGLDATTRS